MAAPKDFEVKVRIIRINWSEKIKFFM